MGLFDVFLRNIFAFPKFACLKINFISQMITEIIIYNREAQA